MSQKIIKTVKTGSRNPVSAFLYSICFPGLGQIYNSDIVKGIAFFSLRTISIMTIPVYSVIKRSDSYITLFTAMIGISILITILSSIEAFVFAKKEKSIPLKKYNSCLFYITFAVISILTTLLALIILFSIFNIEKISDIDPGPALDNGEFVLIKKYMPQGIKKGDLVIFNRDQAGRILGLEGDTVKLINNKFYVNNEPLIIGIFNEKESNKFSLEYNEDIFSEKINTRKYPIRLKFSKKLNLKKFIKVNKNKAVIVKDNRINKIYIKKIPIQSIRGRIEGIIFSKKFKKILMEPSIIIKLEK